MGCVASKKSTGAVRDPQPEVPAPGAQPAQTQDSSTAAVRGQEYTFRWLDEGICCFAFPGSCRPVDWAVDFSFQSVPWVTEHGPKANIHQGFLERFCSLADTEGYHADLEKAMQASTCLFVGHSLGGALACLAAIDCKAWKQQRASAPSPARVQCITFGAPLIGDYNLQRYINEAGWQHDFLQVCSRHDIVPRMLISKHKGFTTVLGSIFATAKAPILLLEGSAEATKDADVHDLGQQVKKVFEPLGFAPKSAAKAVVAACSTSGAYRPIGRYLLYAHGGMLPLDKPQEVLQALFVTMTQSADPLTTGKNVIREHSMRHYMALVQSPMAAEGQVKPGSAVLEARTPFEFFVAKEMQANAGAMANSKGMLAEVQGTLAAVRSILSQANTQPAAGMQMQKAVPMFAERLAECIIGRDSELGAVCEAMRGGGSVVIVGGPGEGKSSLANEAGVRLWEWGTCPAGVFHVDLQGVQPGQVQLLMIKQFGVQLQTCQGGLDDNVEVTFSTLLHWLHCLPPSRGALLILETVEDALADHNRAQELRAVLQQLRAASKDLRLVCTSRLGLGSVFPGSKKVELGKLDSEAALQTLQHYSGDSASIISMHHQQQITEVVCECNPYALSIVGSLLRDDADRAQEFITDAQRDGLGGVNADDVTGNLQDLITARLHSWLQRLDPKQRHHPASAHAMHKASGRESGKVPLCACSSS
ncbi:hypothetical protein WJX73_006366 [Symbiochloris irregularis]|uniref:Fungal lipase-type domain-containing protein n=1 Tax=Symbiochloris irregularis TaxID=706552 RepID=A0AAW1PL67_9CHLO